VASAVWPWSSPRLEDKSAECPSTGPWPCMESSGFPMSCLSLVDNIHACAAVSSLSEASLAPNSG
jgi:hypothetical protein